MKKNYTILPQARPLRNIMLLIFFHVVFMGISSAQDVLVSVEQKTSVFPSQVSNYIDNPYSYFRIRLQNLTGQTQRIYLTLDISCTYSASGEMYRIGTDDGRRTTRPVIELAPNQSYVIDNRDRYDSQFAGRMTTNMSNGTISSMLRLPEGNYNLCVKACRWSQTVSSDNAIGENCMSFMVCYTGSAPELIPPVGGLTVVSVGEAIPEVEPARNLNFRWTGVITNCLQMARFDYTLKIVKVQPGQNYMDAIKRNGTFFSKNCGNKTFCTLDTMRDLNQHFERGATYALQVIATQRGNTTLQLGNEGKSMVQCFKWGHKDAYIPGNTTDEDEDVDTTSPPPLIPAWNMYVNQSQSSFNDRGKVLDSILPPCIVLPEKDKIVADILTQRRSEEENNFPEIDRTVVGTYLVDGTPVIDTAAKRKFDIKWLPASHNNIMLVDYEVKLYEYMGDYTVTLNRPALKTKSIEGATNMYYGYENRDLRNLGDPSWVKIMVPGKQYMVVLTSHVGFYYNTYIVTKNERFVNNNLDSTYYDTVARRTTEATEYTSKMIFQWGIDNSLLDKLTPPQFSYPVNRNIASWNDQSLMEFEDNIPEIPQYSDFSFDWKEAEGYDVSDTMLYDLYIYDCKPGKKMSEIIKGEHKWVYKGIKDVTLTDSIADSVKSGSKYIARLRVRTSPDSNKYNRLNDGWSLPIAFKIVDTAAFMDIFDVTNACYPGDTAKLSRKVATPSVEDLVKNRTRLKMGKFDLIVQSGKLNGKKYSGEGFIVWRPTRYGCNIKVKFDSIVINENNQIISGTANSIHTDENNYVKMNVPGNKWTAGFDMASDKANEYMDKIANLVGDKSEDLKTWYDRIQTSSNVITEIIHSGSENELSMGTVTAPIRIDNKMLNTESSNFAVAVNDFFFTPVTAQINLLAIFGAPRDNVYIPLLATNICISPDSFFPDSINGVNLFSPRDYEFELADGYTMRFKKPSNFAQVKDGCFMKIKKNGPEFTIDVDIDFGKNGQDGNKLLAVNMKNNGIVDPTKPVQAHFTTTFTDWEDWVVKISMDPFTVVGCEDYTFVPTGRGIIFDHSKKRTPKEVRFPANYMKRGEQNKWQGLYIDYFGILMPEDVSNTFVDLNGEKDDTPDSTIIYRVGANGEKTDTVEYVYPGHRISFTASQLVWDKDGLSVMVSVNDIFKADTRNGGGWYFSLDTVGLNIEKSKFKYGKICGKVRVPLFEGRMAYSCMLATDSLVFAVTPNDSLNLNLFLAKVKLDPKSSYFRINHDKSGNLRVSETDNITGSKYTMLSQNSTTRIDLTLNGTIDINFEKMGVEASLPAIKFEKMYLRNFRDRDVQRGKEKVKAYEFGSLDFCIGNWSKASPQKYIGTAPRTTSQTMTDGLAASDIEGGDDGKKGKGGEEGESNEVLKGSMGGFEYSITTFEPKFSEISDQKGVFEVGIDFAGKMTLGISESMTFGANAGFGIFCKVDTKDWKVSDWEGHFDSVRFKTDIGPLKVDAAIMHTSNDPVFGNSWRGMAKVTVVEVVTAAMGCGFGSLQKPDGSGEFDWWYFEGAAQLQKGGVPLGPVSINGFGGGFAYNCAPAKEFAGASAKDMMSSNFVDGMVSQTGSNYRPQYDAWMAKAGISLCLTGEPKTLNADGTLNLRIANGHFSGICLQVNAHMMSSYDEDKKESSGSMLDIGAFIDYTRRGEGDWSLTFSAIAKSQIDLTSLIKNAAPDFIPSNIVLPGSSLDEVNGLVPSALSKYVEPMVEKTNADADVTGKMERFNNFDFGGGASIQIPIDLFINKTPGKNTQWYFSVGRPAYEDRVQFSYHYDLVVMKSSAEFTFYFMTGNHFPDEYSLPAIPNEVADFLGEKYKDRAEKGRYLPTFKDGGGFAVGASFKASIKYSMILFVEASAYIGFDAAFLDSEGQSCEGYSQIGKNGFYGMGQAYMMLKGKAGLELNLGFWKGQLDLIDAGLGAIIQAGGPQPTWAFGMLRFKCTCLGGTIKINTAVDFELGHTCVPGASDPLANVKLFQSVTPGYTYSDYKTPKNIISPFTSGVIVSNLPWNEDVLLTSMSEKGQTITRKFRFILDEEMSKYKYWGRGSQNRNTTTWVETPMTITTSPTDANTLYFQSKSGGFLENKQQLFHFYGRVFEWRTTTDHDLSQIYLARDTAFNVYTNRCSVKWSPLVNPKRAAWRKPLYTDNGVTTFKINKSHFQDTVIYLKTESAPENLTDQVVYTWPYNGDPSVPCNEIFHKDNRYKALIYVYSHREFLPQGATDSSGRQMKAFLVEDGWGETATAEACKYEYYQYGYQGSSIPCIVVTLPSDFNPSNYKGKNLAIRLMMVREKEFQAQLDALNNKVNELMTTTRNEQQTRSNLGELYKDYLTTSLGAIYSGNTGTTVVQDTTLASGASTGEGATDTKFNIRLAQLKAASEEYMYGEKDTAMNYNRKSLASGYVAAVRVGKSVYNLFFGIHEKYDSYNDLVAKMNPRWLFSPKNSEESLKYNGNDEEKYTISKKTPKEEKDIMTARMGYLLDEYAPENTEQYKQGVRLPPILNVCISFRDGVFDGELYQLYKVYANKAAEINTAIKNTTLVMYRPHKDCRKWAWTHWDYLFCSEIGDKNWFLTAYDYERTNFISARNMGLVKTDGVEDFTNRNNGLRISYDKSSPICYSNSSIAGALITFDAEKDFHLNNAPRRLFWKNLDTKGRVDSVTMAHKPQRFVMSDYYFETKPKDTYSASFEITDMVFATMLDDIKKYHDFFQQIHDYGVFMHSKDYNKQMKELNYLLETDHIYNKMSFSTSPITFAKSVFIAWYVDAFTAVYKYNEKNFGEIQFETPPGAKKSVKESDLISLVGKSATYWSNFVFHSQSNSYKYAIDKMKGLTTPYISSEEKWFGKAQRAGGHYDDGLIYKPNNNTQGLNGYHLDIYFATYGTSNNLIGAAANMAYVTTFNSTYRPFVATSFKYGSSWWTSLDVKKPIGETLLKYYKLNYRKNADNIDADWFDE